MRALPPSISARIADGRLAVRYMLRLDLPGGPEGVWSGDVAIAYGGCTFAPLAGALEVSEIPGSAGLSVDQMEITAPPFTGAIVDLLNSNDWHQSPATVFRAYLNDAGAVDYVEAMFSGFFDQAPVSSADNQLYTVTAVLESTSRELDRANGRTRSDADQRAADSTDAIYGYVGAVTATQEISWGRAGPKNPFR